MAKSTSKTASTAIDLFKGYIVFGLTLALVVVGELKCLNISLQKKTQTVSVMHAAID